MSQEDESNIDKFLWDALRGQVSSCTYCFVNRTAEVVGTAIAVQIGEQFFLASAKHVIGDDHQLEVPARDGVAPAVSSDFITRCCHDQLDIGFLELKPDVADRFYFADSTRLLTETDDDRELPALVVGYPDQFINSRETQIAGDLWLRLHGCAALIYRSVVPRRSEWPDDSSFEAPLVSGRDLLVDFNPPGEIKILPPGTSLDDAPKIDCPELDPHGISGGGIWLAQVEERNGGLQVPDARLIGIQTGWFAKYGWLKGVRIGAWLDMLSARYPQLANRV